MRPLRWGCGYSRFAHAAAFPGRHTSHLTIRRMTIAIFFALTGLASSLTSRYEEDAWSLAILCMRASANWTIIIPGRRSHGDDR